HSSRARRRPARTQCRARRPGTRPPRVRARPRRAPCAPAAARSSGSAQQGQGPSPGDASTVERLVVDTGSALQQQSRDSTALRRRTRTMAEPWRIEGEYLENCNCEVLCPCLLGPRNARGGATARPTEGHCDVPLVFRIERGQYGRLDLGGTHAALVLHPAGRRARRPDVLPGPRPQLEPHRPQRPLLRLRLVGTLARSVLEWTAVLDLYVELRRIAEALEPVVSPTRSPEASPCRSTRRL